MIELPIQKHIHIHKDKLYLDGIVPDTSIYRLVVEKQGTIIFAFEFAPAAVQAGCALVKQHLTEKFANMKRHFDNYFSVE